MANKQSNDEATETRVGRENKEDVGQRSRQGCTTGVFYATSDEKQWCVYWASHTLRFNALGDGKMMDKSR